MIVENVDKGKEVNIDQENASSVLGNPLIVSAKKPYLFGVVTLYGASNL